ncbi:hypothetical protein H5P28_10450 [Ruficoccus amylovorans]|uniref:Uncharacterized protein n=1 Tax=Ruficoccus amylovorans TaxID=1804625 RepID=A0A842HEN1_9BACT|nr:hypothetical protein [Ruficoccus amylovorans]MBC2594680.1 hypothetical protein [Ruficoccus amylovorans]
MFRCCLPLVLLFATLLPLHAQNDPVVVQNVNFNSSVSPFDWNNIIVKVRGQENPNKEALNDKYVDNVGVRMTLGYRVGNPRDNKFYFLQSEVTIATLEIGKDKSFAFWVPYDIIKRGNFNKEPDYWVIELTVDGQALPMRPSNTSRNVTDAAGLTSFMNAANAQVGQTEGIMMPGYLSPYPPIDRSPAAFIRKQPK